MKKHITLAVLAGLTFAAFSTAAKAQTTTYQIQDLLLGSNEIDPNISDTFAGTGYVGIYTTNSTDSGVAGANFGQLLGLENYKGVYSETEMQVGIGSLAGDTINSAILSYNLNVGASLSQGVTVTSFTDNGILSFTQTPPSNLGSTTFTSTGFSNSVDVTSLLQSSVATDANWLGLYLTPNGPGDVAQWTFSGAGTATSPDAADVRLVVDYTSGATVAPEPGALALLAGLGVSGIGFFRRRRASVKRVATTPQSL
jgi:hypothetical protein